MARSRLPAPSNDLITDSGAVLWSFVQGEQLELPVELDFLVEADMGYTYEAVVVEAENVEGSENRPVDIEPGGVQTTLNIRIPVNRGHWELSSAYNAGDIVEFYGVWYLCTGDFVQYEDSVPGESSKWIVTTPKVIHLQFPSTLSDGWAASPVVGFPVYGFFELRVTEPAGGLFQRTWKPVRGMVEVLFSPTSLVP